MSEPAVTAVVTGSAGGIGRAIAARLAADGYGLLLVDRSDAVNDQVEQLRAAGGSVDGCTVALEDPDASTVVAEAVAALGRPLGVLVNNAGITQDARLERMTRESFREVVDVNLVATMRLTLGLGERLVFAPGAAVVNVSSRAALGNFGQVNYVASKAGIVGFTRALALSWADRARVNAVAPGLIDTPMTRAMPTDVRDKLVGRIPLGRMGSPEDVAETIGFLAGPSASYVTGQVLLCCGGRSVAP